MTKTLKNPLASTIAFLKAPPARFARKEEVIAYFLFKLLEAPSYVCALQQLFIQETGLNTSTTMTIDAMRHLEDNGVVHALATERPAVGRGRPHINFTIADQYRKDALEIAALWSIHIKGGTNA